MNGPQSRFVRVLLSVTRLWLPVAIAITGIAMIIIGQGRTHGTGVLAVGSSLAAAGVGFIIVAITVWMINWFYRMSLESNRDREEEEAARNYFDEHGHWPDEDTP